MAKRSAISSAKTDKYNPLERLLPNREKGQQQLFLYFAESTGRQSMPEINGNSPATIIKNLTPIQG